MINHVRRRWRTELAAWVLHGALDTGTDGRVSATARFLALGTVACGERDPPHPSVDQASIFVCSRAVVQSCSRQLQSSRSPACSAAGAAHGRMPSTSWSADVRWMVVWRRHCAWHGRAAQMAKRSRPDGADHPDRRRSAGCGRPEWCGLYCCELMARHAIDRGARSAHRGRDRACGGDIRRRAAPLSNPRPAQPALPAIRSVARARTADGIRRLPCPRSRDPTARSCLPCGHRRLAPRHPRLQRGPTVVACCSAAAAAA